MGRELTIREAEPADAAAIRALARAAWHAAYDDVLGAETVEEVVDDWYALDGLRENVTDPGDVFLVATVEGDLAGFAHARPGDDVAELARLYVAPDRWNRGIGTTLLARVEYLLRERGFDRLQLAVLADNEVGVSFYESSGFERVAASEVELDGQRHGEYVYEKGL